MAKDVAILFDSPWALGGTITYAVHLAKATGLPLVKPGKSERDAKPLMGAVPMTTMPYDEIIRRHKLLIMPIPHDKYPDGVYKKGIVVNHGGDEITRFPEHWRRVQRRYTVRTAAMKIYDAEYIPIPYGRIFGNEHHTPKLLALQHCVFNSPKGVKIMLEANRLLPAAKRIVWKGTVHRTFWYFAVKDQYPEYKIPTDNPKLFNEGAKVARQAWFNIDLTKFHNNEGGGATYCLLESMDAGAVPVMSQSWVSAPGPARTWGPGIENVDQLVRLLKDRKHHASKHGDWTQGHIEEQREHNWKQLRHFSYKNFSEQFNDWLRRHA